MTLDPYGAMMVHPESFARRPSLMIDSPDPGGSRFQRNKMLAERFAVENRDTLRYIRSVKKWRYWNGRIWQDDETLHSEYLCHKMLRLADPEMETTAKGTIQIGQLIKTVMSLARHDPRLASDRNQWDPEESSWLLNTPDSLIDLRTGQPIPRKPNYYITKKTSVSPADAPTPLWSAFLNRITSGDIKLQRYLQRVFGYALSGDISEQTFFFAYGTGANGKSVIMNTISKILGDYHAAADIKQFVGDWEHHPTYMAALMGARLVTASETEKGRRWNEPAIKRLTSGDPIRTHLMRQDTFVFTPQFKIFIAGNDRPSIGSADEAIIRRMHVIPFEVTIPREERNPKLYDDLRPEWPGILHWLIQGCLDWLHNGGLQPPSKISEASSEYFSIMDSVTAWFNECCIRDPNGWTQTGDLFSSWERWALDSDVPKLSKNPFSQQLERRGGALGIKRLKRAYGVGYKGVRLVSNPSHSSMNGRSHDDSDDNSDDYPSELGIPAE